MKLVVLFLSIMLMCIVPYILNLSGLLVNVPIDLQSFLEGLRIYILAGLLMFLCVLPVILLAVAAKKGYILAVCIAIIYALASFLASWVPPLASLLPIDVAWRILQLDQFPSVDALSVQVPVICLALFSMP